MDHCIAAKGGNACDSSTRNDVSIQRRYVLVCANPRYFPIIRSRIQTSADYQMPADLLKVIKEVAMKVSIQWDVRNNQRYRYGVGINPRSSF